MDCLNRLPGCLRPHTNTGTVQEISNISCPGQNAIQTVHSSHVVYSDSKNGKTDGHTLGYKDPQIPRQLIGESQIPPSLSPAYTGSSKNVSGTRLASEFREIRAGLTNTGPVAEPPTKSTGTAILTGLSGLAIHVLDRSANCHRETSSPWPTTHETHTVASQKQLEHTGITGKGHSGPQVLAHTSIMVAGGKKCASGSTITPTPTCSANFCRHIKKSEALT